MFLSECCMQLHLDAAFIVQYFMRPSFFKFLHLGVLPPLQPKPGEGSRFGLNADLLVGKASLLRASLMLV